MAKFTVTFNVDTTEQNQIRQKLVALSDQQLADFKSLMNQPNSDMSEWFESMADRETERRA